MARGKRSRAYRDLQDSGSCGQGTCKLRDKNEQIWLTDEGNVKNNALYVEISISLLHINSPCSFTGVEFYSY